MADDIRQQIDERHSKVTAIITRHLDQIREEILTLDPNTLNLDNAGDSGEIARQVLTGLVDQLRGFSWGARRQRREERPLLED